MRDLPLIYISGVGVLSAYGAGYAGLGRALLAGTCFLRPSLQLAQSHPGTLAAEVEPLPEAGDAGERRTRMQMSRSAILAYLSTRDCLQQAGFSAPRDDIGFYLGVGASGGSMEQLTAMLAASVEGGELSWPRFGEAGLRACSPLYAFQLMNNFTLCHSAILHGLGGPNAAFFSRGAGTVLALAEALCALAEGECRRALAGAADSAVHPVTFDELRRQGATTAGLVPGEAAAVFALQREPAGALAQVEHCAVYPLAASTKDGDRLLSRSQLDALLPPAAFGGEAPALAILAASGPAERAFLHELLRQRAPTCRTLDLCAALGDSLAASPALAWAAAIDLLQAQQAERVLVLSLGLDGDLGVTVVAQPTGGRAGVMPEDLPGDLPGDLR